MTPPIPYLNIKSTPKNTYDAIVVGSGISGGWAAKELCEKGLNIRFSKFFTLGEYKMRGQIL